MRTSSDPFWHSMTCCILELFSKNCEATGLWSMSKCSCKCVRWHSSLLITITYKQNSNEIWNMFFNGHIYPGRSFQKSFTFLEEKLVLHLSCFQQNEKCFPLFICNPHLSKSVKYLQLPFSCYMNKGKILFQRYGTTCTCFYFSIFLAKKIIYV